MEGTALEQQIAAAQPRVAAFFNEIEKVIVGQRDLTERILLGLIAGGHILIEGLPGLAKTLAVKTLASVVDLRASRIQFTPDMLPADLIGAPIYDQQSGTFQVKQGPIFANIILADEINRAPAKVQSALLEAMQERQVTIGDQSFVLPEPFLVLATQNMIEQDGTYPLPESQLDRFMLKVRMTYPSRAEEEVIVQRMAFTQTDFDLAVIFHAEEIMALRGLANQVYLEDRVRGYILDIVAATRQPQTFGLPDLTPQIEYGVSPRAAIHLALAAKSWALIQGRAYVRPQDVQAVALDVLGHRLIESYQARVANVTAESIVAAILDHLDLP